MATATRTAPLRDELDLDQYSQDDLDTLLFTDSEGEKPQARYNLPAMMGVATLLVTLLYIVGEIGGRLLPFLNGALDFSSVVPFALTAAIATIFFTVAKPRRRRRRKERQKMRVNVKKTDGIRIGTGGKRLMKSRKGKIAGVAGGIAEHFGWDPTVVRLLFVVGAFVTQGIAIPLYLLLAAVLPKPEAVSLEERIRIIRDS